MNLKELAEFVCGKVRLSNSAALDKCKEFIRRRDEMVWNEALWRVSLYQMNLTYEVANPLHAAGIYLLPRVTDRVIAVRGEDRELRAENVESFFRQDLDVFAESGEAMGFYVMEPVCWMSLEGKAITVRTAAGATDGKSAIRWRTEDHDQDSGEFDNAPGDGTEVAAGVVAITDFSKPTTNGAISICADGTEVISLAAGKTFFEPYTPLRLVRMPTADTTVKVLVKRKWRPLSDDYDRSDLLNVDNVLIAFAMGDMLEWDRQYGKAQAKFQEGQAMLEQLKGVEEVQQANGARLIPQAYEEGSLLGGKGYW